MEWKLSVISDNDFEKGQCNKCPMQSLGYAGYVWTRNCPEEFIECPLQLDWNNEWSYKLP